MTHGVTNETPTGMSLEYIDRIIEAIRYERFQWLPVRRVYIPKNNGKKRPLGLPDWSAKLVQEIIRLILEAYYEPRFSEHSHGFRPQRSCATALREIHHGWKGTVWFIEGDISKCFDNLSHELLLSELREHFHDERFIRLIEGLLKAGYMEDWTYNETLSGTAQGGIVSPILANILMDKLDTFEEAEKLRRQAQSMPSQDPHDPNFRRLKYVRYADDFLLGFIGSKSEAEKIKQQLRTFLQEELKLELSEEKTLVTHARSESARFLSYEITTLHNDAQRQERR
jgi:group II intron reverse transcriptase/maturase